MTDSNWPKLKIDVFLFSSCTLCKLFSSNWSLTDKCFEGGVGDTLDFCKTCKNHISVNSS